MIRFLAFILIDLCDSVATAQTPRTINYQGYLTNNSGQAVADGNQSITSRIFDVSTGETTNIFIENFMQLRYS